MNSAIVKRELESNHILLHTQYVQNTKPLTIGQYRADIRFFIQDVTAVGVGLLHARRLLYEGFTQEYDASGSGSKAAGRKRE